MLAAGVLGGGPFAGRRLDLAGSDQGEGSEKSVDHRITSRTPYGRASRGFNAGRNSAPGEGQGQLPLLRLAQPLHEMAAAQGDIAVVAADLGLGAGFHRAALLVDA